MATQCGDILSKEAIEQLREAEEGAERREQELQDRLWEEYAKEAPAIEAAIKEGTERMLFFESDPEGREALFKSGLFGDFSPEEINATEKNRAQQESVSFRTLHGEFEIRQDPGSNLPIEEVKRIYREETPQCVIQNLQGVGHSDKVKQTVRKGGKPETILGEHRSYLPNKDGTPYHKSEIHTYKHPQESLKLKEETEKILRRGNPDEIRQALVQKEKETHFHEIAEEIVERHFTLEEEQECAKIYEEAIKSGATKFVCDHAHPTASEYVCDAYAMFKTNPQGLKSIDERAFRLWQNKYVSLEAKDTFASLEGQEDEGE